MIKNNFDQSIYFDSHTHYNLEPLNNDLDTNIKELNINKVFINNIGTNLVSSKQAIEISYKYNYICSVGIHPCDCYDLDDNSLIELENLIKENLSVVKSIGECGLDYHYEDTNKQKQFYWFKKQIELALKYKLNLIIHVRDAHEDLLNILDNYNLSSIHVLIHCFIGDVDLANKYLAKNFYIAIGGSVTFKKSDELRQVAQSIDLNKLLTETDSPYLAPVPLRGSINNSNNIKIINEYIATLRNCNINEFNEIIKNNFKNFFNIID